MILLAEFLVLMYPMFMAAYGNPGWVYCININNYQEAHLEWWMFHFMAAMGIIGIILLYRLLFKNNGQ